jgi:hypothetical protein
VGRPQRPPPIGRSPPLLTPDVAFEGAPVIVCSSGIIMKRDEIESDAGIIFRGKNCKM